MSRKEKVQKTNALRELDRAGIAYGTRAYEVDEDDLSGVHVAAQLGEDPACVFKTLVTVDPHGDHVVCCIPVAEELDLKAAARAAGAKSLSMMHVRDLFDVTGYIRGGCSPVGMKRRFTTVIDETCQLFDAVFVSAGRRGLQLEIAPDDLAGFCEAKLADICASGEDA